MKINSNRNKLLLAAKRRLACEGYYATSLQQIADDVGVAQTTVLYHFKSKIGLFEDVVGLIIQENRETVARLIQEEDSALERLKKHFLGTYRWAVEHDYNAQIVISLYHFASLEPTFNMLYTKVRTAARLKIQSYLEEGVCANEFQLKRDASFAAEVLHDHLLGSLVNIIAGEKPANSFYRAEEKWNYLLESFIK